MIFYFDKNTGRRVSKSTWTRSKAHGGSRYVRRSVERKRVKKKKKPAKQPTTFQEWQGLYEEGYEDHEEEIETSIDY
jgi:hypothetical protein